MTMRALFPVALTIALSTTACTKDADTSAPVAPATSTTPGPVPIPPKIEGPIGTLLESYDGMQKALAKDDPAGALPFAEKILASARTAGASETGEKQAALTAIGDLAQKLTLEKPSELEAVRSTFADLSKNVVTLLVADEKLREGRFLFECPMAKGYQKWVQTTAKLQNPYFGSKMLECGSDVPWKV